MNTPLTLEGDLLIRSVIIFSIRISKDWRIRNFVLDLQRGDNALFNADSGERELKLVIEVIVPPHRLLFGAVGVDSYLIHYTFFSILILI